MVPNTRLQAKVKDGSTEVKALIKHPMETGSRKDQETGKLIPAHFITEVKCEYNGQIVMSTLWGVGISADPYLSFKFKGGQAGEKIKLTWTDNLGATESTEAKIEEEEKKEEN